MSDGPPGPLVPAAGGHEGEPPETPSPLLAPGAPVSAPPRRRRWPLLAAAGLVLVGGGAAFLLLRPGGPDHPDEWDARILHLVEFVEDERRLTFEHPVAVDFLDEAEWEEETNLDEEDILDEDAQLLEHGEGMFRALGFAEGDLDLLSDIEDLGTSGTIGRYVFEDERIAVRGDSLSPATEATLVHELTHVLQDQHFDIGDRIERVTEEDTSEESLRVLVEGDADRIEDLWEQSLSEDEQQALEDDRNSTQDGAAEALDALPASLVTFFASDYILGAGFMAILEAAEGTAAIDDAFASPPGPEEHVFDPISFLEDDEPSEVEVPEVEGEPIPDLEGEFGAVGWFLMLAERTDPVVALAALDGWGGDAYRAYRDDDDRTCVALRFVGEEASSAEAMEDALLSWAEKMPSEAGVTVKLDGDTVDAVACDPGVDAEVLEGGGRSREVISLLSIRSSIAANVLDGGGTSAQARCFSRGLIASLGYEVIISDDVSPEQQRQIEQVATEQGTACREA